MYHSEFQLILITKRLTHIGSIFSISFISIYNIIKTYFILAPFVLFFVDSYCILSS